MRVAITGAAGFLGRKLAERIAAEGSLAGREVEGLTLYDRVEPVPPAAARFQVTRWTGDLAAPGETDRVVGDRPDIVFHLAAIVSGEAEQDFDGGYRTNVDAARLLFESIRRAYPDASPGPRVILASSLAVFGAPFPERIPDDFHLTPLTSYGTQKAICELLLADYTRKGMLDGIGLRLPTICIRPGAPNRAASGFFSSICREPLAGQEAVLPVSEDVRHWFASPRAAVGFLTHAATIESAALDTRRSLTMPGLSVTVGEEIEALRRVGGEGVAGRIRREPDPFIARIVAGWPRDFDTRRAYSLGFCADRSFDDIIRSHIDDELGGQFVA